MNLMEEGEKPEKPDQRNPLRARKMVHTSMEKYFGAEQTIQVDMIKAWNKFSAVRFCSGVPEMRAMRPPREFLESEISIIAPDI